ncbi:MAG: efflux RND transporter periplasmic adaptor subunit [Candidatus Marinimicrobia bacterium]|nr:efflux RND transporter periplasmic adaptor subunit [Candidatus Neomarinimicrobiota bacterium]MCF7829520.1 efflux RND transporter periplasmic adaptor subunit [Candidatus Neomarinimicrobiota bacterium]MCF7880082.1 efflux RND transporter periplasmic adaptor subunit [Candidatus Neomarinimicrobiota bacterium]
MFKKKKFLIGGGIVIILAVLIFFGTREKTAGAVAVDTQIVGAGEIIQKVNATGRVQPAVEVNISANVSGEIMDLGVLEGDNVQKGQFLVQLDQERYQASLEQAKSMETSAAADLKLAKSELRRTEDLHKKGLASEAELEAAQASVDKAQSNLEQRRASLKQARDDLSKTRILSPIAGTVTKLDKEVGEIAMGSTFQRDLIMTIADLSTMEVIVEVDESDVIDVSLGDSVDVEVDALPDTVFNGTVTEIAHSAVTTGAGSQEQVTNFEITVTLNQRAPELRPGMTADVAIITEVNQNAIVVPIQAVTVRAPMRLEQKKPDSLGTEAHNNPGKAKKPNAANPDKSPVPLTTQTVRRREEMSEVVFVLNEDEMEVEQRAVKTGISSDTHFEILSGLETGEEIVVGSYRAVSRDLQDGTMVERSGSGGGPDFGASAP